MTVDFRGCYAEVWVELNRVVSAVRNARATLQPKDFSTAEFTLFIGYKQHSVMSVVNQGDIYALRDQTFMACKVVEVQAASYLKVALDKNLIGD